MGHKNNEEVINYSENKIKFHWNPLTQQPNIPYSKWQRNIEYLKFGKDHFKMLWYSIKLLPKLIPAYINLLKKNFNGVINKGFCIGVENNPSRFEKIIKEVKEIGAKSVLLRIPIWDIDEIEESRNFLIELKRMDIEPVITILQDYRSVSEVGYWRKGLERIFNEFCGVSKYFGVGHAWNRYKWGVRSFMQYLDLVEQAEEIRKFFPDIRLIGPSVIDFEYICTMGVLNHPKRRPKFDIVNALLYVDRQGAPENKHFGFDLSTKTALMRAIINSVYGEETPFWITETNWPLRARSEYVPTSLKESVDEETYADYLVRYYILALTSGAQRVYWWQLVAHGYGIIDDIDGKWRRRPAWKAFRTMAGILDSFVLKNKMKKGSIYSFTFENHKGEIIRVFWSLRKGAILNLDFDVEEIISRDGDTIPLTDSLILTSSPVYLVSKKGEKGKERKFHDGV